MLSYKYPYTNVLIQNFIGKKKGHLLQEPIVPIVHVYLASNFSSIGISKISSSTSWMDLLRRNFEITHLNGGGNFSS